MVRIRILGAGGTIASRSGLNGAIPTESVATLFGAAGPPPEIDVEFEDVLRRGSFALTPMDVRVLSERVAYALEDPLVDGLVLAHGTDTLEETAFLLDLVHDDPRPLVLTGAQIPGDRPGADGARNLTEAVRLAATPGLRRHGVLVGFAGGAWAARGTRKAHTTAASPFRGGLPVAEFVGDAVHVRGMPQRTPALVRPDARFDRVRVAVIVAHIGADPALFEAALAHSDAVVLAGTGVGNAGTGFARAIARSQTPVILASRVDRGPVVPMYGDGGGVDLVAAGALPADLLSAVQARMLVALLLSHGHTGADLVAAFERFRSPKENR